MSNRRPNTLIIVLIVLVGMIRLAFESIYKGIYSFFTTPLSLTPSRLLRIWHWIAVEGPKKFWKSPKAVDVGRSISTLIQALFYPKK